MLYEIALLPDTFDAALLDQSRAVALKVLLRELNDNGLVADLNKQAWHKYVRKLVETLPYKLRSEVASHLKTLESRHRLVRHPKVSSEPSEDLDWHSLATTLEDLYAIVSAKTPENASIPRTISLDDVLESEVWNARARTWRVGQNEDDLEKALIPLLRYARKLLLVDPYLRPSKHSPVVKICAKLMGCGRGNSKGHIEFHTREPGSTPEDWRRLLEPLHDQYGHTFRVKTYENPSKDGGQRFHDRFILTDQCGVSVSAGLDLVSGSQTDWHLMDFSIANSHQSDFESPNHPYLELVGQSSLVVPTL